MMVRFRFETLLNQRRHAEETCQREFSEARRLLAEEQAELSRLKNALRAADRQWRRRQTRHYRPVDLQLHTAHMEDLVRTIEAQRKRVDTAERQLRLRRQGLIEAVKKRKILEKLEEKDRKEHERKLAAREIKLIDEVAGRIAARPAERI